MDLIEKLAAGVLIFFGLSCSVYILTISYLMLEMANVV